MGTKQTEPHQKMPCLPQRTGRQGFNLKTMKQYSLPNSKNVLSTYRQELNQLRYKQGLTGLKDSEKERLRDLSKMVLDNTK
jgi:hypothetical protein